MFSAYCQGCGSDVLLTSRRIHVHNTDRGILVTFRCWRGHEGAVMTGRQRTSVATSWRDDEAATTPTIALAA